MWKLANWAGHPSAQALHESDVHDRKCMFTVSIYIYIPIVSTSHLLPSSQLLCLVVSYVHSEAKHCEQMDTQEQLPQATAWWSTMQMPLLFIIYSFEGVCPVNRTGLQMSVIRLEVVSSYIICHISSCWHWRYPVCASIRHHYLHTVAFGWSFKGKTKRTENDNFQDTKSQPRTNLSKTGIFAPPCCFNNDNNNNEEEL